MCRPAFAALVMLALITAYQRSIAQSWVDAHTVEYGVYDALDTATVILRHGLAEPEIQSEVDGALVGRENSCSGISIPVKGILVARKEPYEVKVFDQSSRNSDTIVVRLFVYETRILNKETIGSVLRAEPCAVLELYPEVDRHRTMNDSQYRSEIEFVSEGVEISWRSLNVYQRDRMIAPYEHDSIRYVLKWIEPISLKEVELYHTTVDMKPFGPSMTTVNEARVQCTSCTRGIIRVTDVYRWGWRYQCNLKLQVDSIITELTECTVNGKKVSQFRIVLEDARMDSRDEYSFTMKLLDYDLCRDGPVLVRARVNSIFYRSQSGEMIDKVPQSCYVSIWLQ